MDEFCLALYSADVNPDKSADLWNAINHDLGSGAPFGSKLLTALTQPNFPARALVNLVEYLQKSNQAPEAAILVTALANAVVSMAMLRTDPAEPISDIVTVVRNIAKAPNAAQLLVEGPFFTNNCDGIKGREFLQSTLLGSLLSALNPFGSDPTQNTMLLRLLKMFPSANAAAAAPDSDDDEAPQQNAQIAAVHQDSSAQIRAAVSTGVDAFKGLLDALLKASAPVRAATFEWLSTALRFAAAHRKSMVKEDEEMPFVCVTILTHTCVTLALPIFDQRSGTANPWFPGQFPSSYFFDTSPDALCRFPADEERIITGDAAVAPPAIASPQPAYAPKVHIFALGLRAMAAFFSPCFHQFNQWAQQMNHPSATAQQRMIFSALHAYMLTLLTDDDMMLRYLALADASAEWLLSVLRVKSDGTLPRPAVGAAAEGAEVPPSFATWANLPLTIVDDCFSVAKLLSGVSRTRPPIDVSFFQLRNLASLMLVLMGDQQLFPKPHTHALYPQFLSLLTHKQLRYRNEFFNHPLVTSHVLRGCVECFIAVQKCDHDRAVARYFLSLSMLDLLEDPTLVRVIAAKYNDPQDSTLEQLCSMVTGEATGALENVFENLGQMREIELANNRQPPVAGHDKFAQYNQCGSVLRSEITRAMTSIQVFDALVDHFAAGMARHLVVQQVSSALMSFLLRLAGPSAMELKIADPAKYGFKPREMLHSIVQVFVKFSRSSKFREGCAQAQTNLDSFKAAIKFIADRMLVPADLLDQLTSMANLIIADAEAQELEQELDPPEWAQCALIYTLLVDPVALPSKGADLTFVDRETIRHNLLTSGINPFTREALTMAEVDKFNALPDVAERVAALKRRVAEWKAAALLELREQQQRQA